MAVWTISSVDSRDPDTNEVIASVVLGTYNDLQDLEPGEDGFLDTINVVIEGTGDQATYKGPSPTS